MWYSRSLLKPLHYHLLPGSLLALAWRSSLKYASFVGDDFAIIPAERGLPSSYYLFNVIHHLFEDGMPPPFRQFFFYYRSIYQICDYVQFLKSFLLSDHAPLICLSPVESTPYTFESGIIFCISASNLSQYSNGVLSKTRFMDLLSGVFGNSASFISHVFVFNQFTYSRFLSSWTSWPPVEPSPSGG